jgi:Flp pilus assembly protein TadB
VSGLLLALGLLLLPTSIGVPTGKQSVTTAAPRLRFDWLAAVAVAAVVIVVLPWPWSAAAAAVAGAITKLLVPKQIDKSDEWRELRIARTLPDMINLLAALISTGCTDQKAMQYLGLAAPNPLGGAFAEIARMMHLGAPAAAAWQRVATDEQLAPLTVVMVRRSETGAPVVAELDRLAEEARRDYFTKAQAAARAAAVKSVVPLAVCFLPSFFLLGVVPIVAALAQGLLGGGI